MTTTTNSQRVWIFNGATFTWDEYPLFGLQPGYVLVESPATGEVVKIVRSSVRWECPELSKPHAHELGVQFCPPCRAMAESGRRSGL